MLGFPILYFKDMRPMMFQLSGFYYKVLWLRIEGIQGLSSGYSEPQKVQADSPSSHYLRLW